MAEYTVTIEKDVKLLMDVEILVSGMTCYYRTKIWISEIYDLKNLISESDSALVKAIIWSLERENESLKAKLEVNQDLSSTVREIIPALGEFKENNIKDSLKNERELVCREISTAIENLTSVFWRKLRLILLGLTPKSLSNLVMSTKWIRSHQATSYSLTRPRGCPFD
ncbi:hypothetical protein AVEN_229269-1 [Araneus ventricosus]|uniref:Uncharacterized protein n=1 Tax=Araneus ventricosus TaxID=182803 RepID=A0A4Y2QHX8_ARAVE|nr:hypothetical protein AVEN_229269-1 [Araneus ventricosus]